MKNGILNGLIAAVILSILYLLVNATSPKLNFTFLYPFISTYAVYLVFMIRAGKQESTADKPYGFGDALIPAMICYAVASFFIAIFTFMMFNYDPMLIEYATEASMESIESLGKLMGDQDGAMIEQMEDSQEDIIKSFTSFGTYCINWFVSLFFPGLIFGAIAATVAKKKTITI